MIWENNGYHFLYEFEDKIKNHFFSGFEDEITQTLKDNNTSQTKEKIMVNNVYLSLLFKKFKFFVSKYLLQALILLSIAYIAFFYTSSEKGTSQIALNDEQRIIIESEKADVNIVSTNLPKSVVPYITFTEPEQLKKVKVEKIVELIVPEVKYIPETQTKQPETITISSKNKKEVAVLYSLPVKEKVVNNRNVNPKVKINPSPVVKNKASSKSLAEVSIKPSTSSVNKKIEQLADSSSKIEVITIKKDDSPATTATSNTTSNDVIITIVSEEKIETLKELSTMVDKELTLLSK